MGIYARYLFPPILDWAMGRPDLEQLRPSILAGAQGDILEIGFGTGRNLPHYPPHVRHLTVVEPSPAIARRAAARIRAWPGQIESVPLPADQQLPLDTNRFDTVVSTWTMCSIDNLPAALAEIHRVLKPGGRLLFLEHGLSRSERTATWQHRLTPLNRVIGQGCRLDRDFTAIIAASPLHIERSEEFDLEGRPQLAAHHYRGSAIKS